jgi:hypothetical protein
MEAEERERNPSQTGKKKFQETIDLRSASGWKKWNITLFNFTFEPEEYNDLAGYLRKTYTPEDDPNFDERKLLI